MVTWSRESMERLNQITVAAGHAILDYYHGRKNYQVETKQDDSPVTTADFAANEIICEHLKQYWPYEIISEEEPLPLGLQADSTYWLVDPLDGTQEFVDRTDDFTVNIALITAGVPVVGSIFAPVFGSLYYGAQGLGSFRLLQDESLPSPIHARQVCDEGGHMVAVSRRVYERAAEKIEGLDSSFEITQIGSSLKFCAIAEGLADFYPRRGKISAWDTAAGQCILEQAGGGVWAATGEPLIYDPARLLNPPFLAAGPCGEKWLKVFFTR
ncbi:MAG: 3'(2'),5'-bisphosphate nucleotidase CysQ [Zetaproteobacteria bacterium]|nr:3'(2'),5'-bisphosphate nucleotidase CysQ [Zetaproteobacteria bacterium]